MDEMVNSLFPCVCIVLSYTIFFIFLLKSDVNSLKDEIRELKKTYFEDIFKSRWKS
jgi:hypothetical protein